MPAKKAVDGVSFAGTGAADDSVAIISDHADRIDALTTDIDTEKGSLAVSAAATTRAISFSGAQSNTTYMLIIETTWQTTWIPSSKTVNGLTISFGVPAPTGGGTMYWRLAR